MLYICFINTVIELIDKNYFQLDLTQLVQYHFFPA